MSRAYLLVICLLSASFVGCIEDAEELEKKVIDDSEDVPLGSEDCVQITGQYLTNVTWGPTDESAMDFLGTTYNESKGICIVSFHLVDIDEDKKLFVNEDRTRYVLHHQISGTSDDFTMVLLNRTYEIVERDLVIQGSIGSNGNLAVKLVELDGSIRGTILWVSCKDDCFENAFENLCVVHGDSKGAYECDLVIDSDEDNEIRAIVTTNDETESVMNGEEQISYTFSAAESESESSIIKYEWDFSYDSSEGFTVDKESSDPEITREFDSGLYVIKVRITNEMGESDESSYSDDIDLKINYDYKTTRTIDSGQQEHMFQLYGLPARYIRATLEYESNSVHTKDLDLYLYNTTQNRNPDDSDDEHVDSNTTHNNDDIEQVNIIELDYYNSTDRSWFDESHELGDWTIVIDHERTGSSEYTIRIEVIYWE